MTDASNPGDSANPAAQETDTASLFAESIECQLILDELVNLLRDSNAENVEVKVAGDRDDGNPWSRTAKEERAKAEKLKSTVGLSIGS